jgi:hypothetical protein
LKSRGLLKQVREILWPPKDPDVQWSPAHLDAIGEALEALRLPCDDLAVARAPAREAMELVALELKSGKPVPARFWVYLSSLGIPGHGPYAPVSEPCLAWANTLAGVKERCSEYQREWNLGGGNWPGALFGSGRTVLGHVSYNLRLWEGLPGDLSAREIGR